MALPTSRTETNSSPASQPGSAQEVLDYTVPDLSCSHCEVAVTEAVTAVGGVSAVEVDIEGKRVCVQGTDLDDAAVRAAIDDAGYEVAGS
jgi:copper chaperone CopZ